MTKSQQSTNGNSSGLALIAGPFDWLICPAASTIDLLNNRIPDFEINSISIYKGHPYWSDFNLYFWHRFRVSDRESQPVDIHQTFENELSRWRYLRDQFAALVPSQTVFVISNTQNNLESEVFDKTELDQYHFTKTILDDLRQSLARYFSTTTNHIHLEVLTRTNRATELDKDGSVHFIPIDHNEWKGSKRSWDQWWQTLDVSQ